MVVTLKLAEVNSTAIVLLVIIVAMVIVVVVIVVKSGSVSDGQYLAVVVDSDSGKVNGSVHAG